MTVKLVILGGGLSAVSLAYHLNQPLTIIEKEDTLGGLCRTLKTDNGIEYDIGGHVIFGEQSAVKDMLEMLDGNYSEYERNNKVIYNGRLLDYPFENGVWELSPEERFELGKDYLCRGNKNIPPTNFRDWLITKYGSWLSMNYLIPFNEKLWKMDLRKIDMDWVERIPNPSDYEILSAICGIRRKGYLRLKSFYYPLEGGISRLIDGYIKKAKERNDINIYLNSEVTQIDLIRGIYRIVYDNGKVLEAEKIINTMPLPVLVKCLMNVPDEIYQANQNLQWLNLNLETDNPEGLIPQDVFAIFNPDKSTEWHRCCNYQLFHRHIAVKEISVEKNDNSTIKYAYPVYTHNRKKSVKKIIDYLNDLGIATIGRMATMQYLNMDAVINQVKEFIKFFK